MSFPQVRVNVATLAEVVLSLPVTAVLVRLTVPAVAIGLLLSRLSSPASGCVATDAYTGFLVFYHRSPESAPPSQACLDSLRLAVPRDLVDGVTSLA